MSQVALECTTGPLAQEVTSVVAQDEARASSPEVAILKDFAFELVHVCAYLSASKNSDQRLSRSSKVLHLPPYRAAL